MKKIILLCGSNIRKGKGQTIAFFFVIAMAAMILNLGIITVLNYSDNYDKRFDETNSAHVVAAMKSEYYNEDYFKFITDYEKTVKGEQWDILMAQTSYPYAGATIAQRIIFYNYEEEHEISVRNYTEILDTAPEDAIYLPEVFRTGGGVVLGEQFPISIEGKEHSFTVAGFYEDLNTGRYSYRFAGFTLGSAAYEKLAQNDKNVYGGQMLLARLDTVITDEVFYAMLQDYLSERIDNYEENVMTASAYKIREMSFVNATIMQMLLVAFAIIIVLISLVIIKFKIADKLAEDIESIGVLKSIGYTSKQIILSFIVQFTGIGLFAGILGVAASYAVLPALEIMLSSNSGVMWKQGFDVSAALITVLAIIIPTTAVTLISAGKVTGIPAVMALRKGVKAHNFKKNVFPLESTAGKVDLLLAMKTMMQNIYQNITIVFIVAAVTFASSFCIVVFHNIANDHERFCDLISGEFSSIMLELREPAEDYQAVKDELLENENIRKVLFYDLFGNGFLEDGHSLMIYVSENYQDTENKKCYEGRDCIHDNEIVLNGHLAGKLNKKIGDTIAIKNGKFQKEYIITGLMQSGNGRGYEAELTLEGYRRINPKYSIKLMNVYTKEGADNKQVLAELETAFGDKFVAYTDMDEGILSMIQTFRIMTTVLVIGVLAVTGLIITLSFNLIVKALLMRQKKDIGIKKAVGYTNRKLMLQIALSFLPVVIIGTVAGGILGCIGTNPLLSVMLRGMGLMKVNFIIPVGAIMVLSVLLSVFAFSISMMSARKIKKITTYQLMAD